MKRHDVASPAIASVGYDDASGTLEVEFRSGELCRYVAVDPADADELFEAESPGGYLNERIKPRYRYEHV